MAKKTWTTADIVALLTDSNNARRCEAVKRGIRRLYDFQTSDEQAVGETRHRNGRGFSAFHGASGSRLACKLARGQYLKGACYTADWLANGNAARHWAYKSDMARAQRICIRHARQLADFANGKL